MKFNSNFLKAILISGFVFSSISLDAMKKDLSVSDLLAKNSDKLAKRTEALIQLLKAEKPYRSSLEKNQKELSYLAQLLKEKQGEDRFILDEDQRTRVNDKIKDLIQKIVTETKEIEGQGYLLDRAQREEVNNALKGIIAKMVKESGGLQFNDVIMRGFAGKNWEVIADLNPKDPADAIAYGMAFKGADVLGRHLDTAIESSFGDVLDNTFGGILGGIGRAATFVTRGIRNLITGRSGQPFSVKELNIWRGTVKNLFTEIEKSFKNLSMIEARSRDKVQRSEDMDENIVDPLWLGVKTSLTRQLDFWIKIIASHRVYYNPKSDEEVVFYAKQIEDLLSDIKDNFLKNSKSQKEMGSTVTQQGLQIRKMMLDLYFDNLVQHVGPKAKEEKDSKNTSSSGSNRSRFGGLRDEERDLF